MADYHLHLHRHADDLPVDPDYSVGRMERYVEAAARRGVDEVCFTEHYYRCVESAATLGRFWDDEIPVVAALTERMIATDRSLSLTDYVEAVVAAKAAGLPVRLGLELDFFPSTIEAVLEQIDGLPFDFIVGAVHWVGGLVVDASGSVPIIEERGLRKTWEQYATVVADLGRGGHVDAIAHIDVLKKYGLRLPEEPVDLYETMVAALAEGGVALEINTAGLRKPAAELYPSATFLAMAHAAGIPITLGSDGHEPAEAGQDLTTAVAAARAAGYTHALRFEGRRGQQVPFGT